MRELFTKIELADREAMTPYLSAFRFVDLGFTGLYYCAEAFDIRKAYLCGALCLRIRGEDGYAYVLSDVKKLPEIAELLFASEGTNAIAFDFVKREDLKEYTSLSPYACSVACEEKYADYFSTYADYVSVDKQKALHKYKDYHQFCSRYAHAAYALSKETLPVAAKLLDAWCENHGCAACTTGCEKQWILRLFDAWDALPAKGLIVDVDGAPAGFCVLEQNGDTVLRLVSKPTGRQRGLQVFLGVESARLLFPHAAYVNMGPDSGVANLGLFKDKFRPYTKLQKYRVTLAKKP
ncbi:MAG: phosphatidylglycerol lysyltransferase domain-containing protein [Eubacteriales bacterium]|nr:phosphatidylglycerol lysyltransferase domain-containing protein [Eubacteriales bacterium]